MRVRVNCFGGRVQFEFDANNKQEAFERIATLDDIFSDPGCGNCGEQNIRCTSRKAKGYTFNELVCGDCNHKLSIYTDNEKGYFFACRQDKEKNKLPNNGWVPPYSGGGQQSNGDEHNQTGEAPKSGGDEGIPF